MTQSISPNFKACKMVKLKYKNDHYKKTGFLHRQNAVANSLFAVTNSFCDGFCSICDGKMGDENAWWQKVFASANLPS